MGRKDLPTIFAENPKTYDQFTDQDYFYFATGGADAATTLAELRKKFQASVSESFSATITADKNKNIGSYNLSFGALTLNMAASGNIPGVEVLFKIVADGVNAVNIGNGFDTDALIGIDDGEVLEAGTYLVKLRYEAGGAILELPSKAKIPSGGTAGQVLGKNSAADGDYVWTDLIPGPPGADGADGDRYATSSATSMAIPTSHPTQKTLTVDVGLSYSVSQSVVIARDAANYFIADVVSYNSTTGQMVVDSVSSVGSGTFNLWQINIGAQPGPQGEQGPAGADGADGADGDPGADGAPGADGVGMPAGGAAGQVPYKQSATDYDFGYTDVLLDAVAVAESSTISYVDGPVQVMALSAPRTITGVTLPKGHPLTVRFKGNFAVTIDSAVAPAARVGAYEIRDNETVLTFFNSSEDATPHISVKDFYGSPAASAKGLFQKYASYWQNNLLALGNTTPITIASAPGSDKVHRPKSAYARIAWATGRTVYDTNTTVELLVGSTVIATCNILGDNTGKVKEFTFVDGAEPEMNQPISMRVQSGNPLNGDSHLVYSVEWLTADESTITMPAYTGTPGAPTAVTTTVTSATAATVSWTAPGDDGGSAIAGYKVERSVNQGAWEIAVANTGNTNTSWPDTSLATGDDVQHRVTAINANGAGTVSAASTEVTTWTVPGAPTIVTSLDGSGGVDIAITAPASDGGESIDQYNIYRSTDGGAYSNIGNTATLAYSDLAPGNGTHSYYAKAQNAVGEGAASNIDSETISSVGSVYTTHTLALSGAPNIQGFGVSLPSNYDQNINDYPTIFFFHGAGQAGTNLAVLDDDGILETSTLRDWYASKGFLLIAPQSSDTTNYWQFLHDDVNAFIAWAMKTYRINPNKIYLTGLSAGSEGILQMTVGSSGTVISIEPAAVVAIAGAVGITGAFDVASDFWLFRNEGDASVSSFMDETVDFLLADNNPRSVLFTQFAGSDHAGVNSAWDYVYKTGSNDSTVAHTLGTDPIPVGAGSVTNEPFPGTAPKDNIADWMLSKSRGGSDVWAMFDMTLNQVNAASVDFDLSTNYTGRLYIKAITPNDPAPSNLAIYAGADYEIDITSTGPQTITVYGLPSGTKDIYAMFERDANGARTRSTVIEDVAVPVFAALREGRVNMQYFGGSVTDPDWENTASVQSGTLITDLTDTDDNPTTWDIAATGCTNDNALGGTATEEADIASQLGITIPSGLLARGRSAPANGASGTIDFTGLDDTKQHKAILISYNQYTNREFTAQLASNTSVFINASAGAVAADLGFAQSSSGALSISLTAAADKRFTFAAIILIEYPV